MNPNGGGIRNQYGVWLQERWLRSFVVPGIGKKNVAPLNKQFYAGQPKNGGFRSKKKKMEKKLGRKKFRAITSKEGPPTIETTKFYPESAYDNDDGAYAVTVANWAEFKERLTRDDPWRLERSRRVTGGGDIRYLSIQNQSEDVPEEDKSLSWLMSVDVGLRLRPIQKHLSAVVETRYLQAPKRTQEQVFTGPARTRSAYFLVDDLPFNTFFQYGLYRPLFGHYTPDHTALAQRQAGFTQRSLYRAITIGTAPNVPFFNVHLIQPQHGNATDQSQGYAFSFGLRAVSFGASAIASGWITTDRVTNLTKQMFAYSAGGALSRFVANVELLNFRQEIETERFAQGSVTTLETKARLWRENYAVYNFATSNLAYNFREGAVNENMIGVKSFPIVGTELEVLYITRTEDVSEAEGVEAQTNESKTIQTQLHVFF